jgi:hypothetical protein
VIDLKSSNLEFSSAYQVLMFKCPNCPKSRDSLLQWYKVCDLVLGLNFVIQNISAGLELASSCSHPDASWLCELFEGNRSPSSEEARRVFLLNENDPRSLCFAALVINSRQPDRGMLKRAAEAGNALALAWMAKLTDGSECLKFSEQSTAHGERLGICLLGSCYEYGYGCEKDLPRAKENYLRAADLGDVWAMSRVAFLSQLNTSECWVWHGRAARLGWAFPFFTHFEGQVLNLSCGNLKASGAVFAIGEALKGHVDVEKGTIFSESQRFKGRQDAAVEAVKFFDAQCKATVKAIDAWTIVGIRIGVVKDVRKLISLIVWNARQEANYVVELPKYSRCDDDSTGLETDLFGE